MRQIDWILVGSLAVIVLVVFGGARDNAFVLDAEEIIVRNPRVTEGRFAELFSTDWWTSSEQGLRKTLYRPIPMVLMAAIWKASPDATAFNLTNLLLHAVVAGLRFALVLVLLERLRHRRWIAFGATVLASVHAFAAEGVVGMVGVAEILMSMFLTASWLGFTLGLRGRGPGRGAFACVLALVCFGLALLSKENAVLFPVVLLVQAWLERRQESGGAGTPLSRSLPVVALFGLLVGGWIALRIQVLGSLASFGNQGVFDGFTTVERIRSSLAAMTTVYARALVWPFELTPYVSHQDVAPPTGWGDLRILSGLLVWAVLSGWTLLLIWRRRLAALFGVFFLLTFLPTSNLIIGIGAVAGYRFWYTPVFGLAVLFLAEAFRALEVRRPVGVAALALLAVVALVGAIGSVKLVDEWQDGGTLYAQAARINPRNIWAMQNDTWTRVMSSPVQLEPAERARRSLEALAAFDAVEDQLAVVPSSGRVDRPTAIAAYRLLTNRAGMYITLAEADSDADEFSRLVNRAITAQARAEKYAFSWPPYLLESRLNICEFRLRELSRVWNDRSLPAVVKEEAKRNLEREFGGATAAMSDDLPARMRSRYCLVGFKLAAVQNDEALQKHYLARAAAIDPDNPEILTIQVERARRAGDFAGALTHAKAILALGNASVEPYLLAFELCTQLGRKEEALGYLRASLTAPALSIREAQMQQQAKERYAQLGAGPR